ncbi:hypothetical protein J7I98_02560 [Streptomyces sp. ISL-98]|uniref:hypothetical protein n=1 Tax=Streptomyces sp. ISL-98 TaxID=2819192 RepID=UPI001BE9701E|nr:hypothetical protein [Streptomyces sp. ISL-98]MBT2504793.1 hypothetical protein [Streptomyces sp. ISL-98]
MAPDTPAPAPQGPPTTPDQALAIVRSRYAEPKLPDGTPIELRVQEFDIGYLVYTVIPRRTDPTPPSEPAPPGGANIVVSKVTGETVAVPNLPPELAIARYRKKRGLGA